MCKSTCIYEINEVFIGIFKQCVFTNFTFQRQAFYVNFNKYVNASLKFSNPVGTRFLKKTRSHTKIQNFKTKNVLIWEICLKACKMVLYSTFDNFSPVNRRSIYSNAVMQKPDFWAKEAASSTVRLKTAAQSPLWCPCLSARIGLHLYSSIRKENSAGTQTESCPLAWNVVIYYRF